MTRYRLVPEEPTPEMWEAHKAADELGLSHWHGMLYASPIFVPSDAQVERAARAYDPVGWKWYDEADDTHPAKRVFRQHALSQMDSGIAAFLKAVAEG